MENTAVENSEPSTVSSTDVGHVSENIVADHPNHEEAEPNYDINTEEVRSIMEVIASTGKFWHDWDMLKRLLSFQLKQVLAEYPEDHMASGTGSQQGSLSGETYSQLMKRLDEALLSFTEGPPFTLQRLCEILLAPKSTYSNLSKLALALEKNLLVTSTLSRCTDPYPAAGEHKPEEHEKGSEIPLGHPDPAANGVEPVAGDGDEEMADAEADEYPSNTDTEMQEDKPTEATTDTDAGQGPGSDLSGDASANSEQHNSSTSESL